MHRTPAFSRRAFLISAGAATAGFAAGTGQSGGVVLQRVPEAALQPQIATDSTGTIHQIYFRGEPLAGDLFYVASRDGGASFSRPIQVNQHAGSVVATGSVRGAHLAAGKGGRVHIAWNGSKDAQPKGPSNAAPMLYTRMNAAGTAFEPERNVIHSEYGLDGGGAIAADPSGNVYVFWHAPTKGQEGEAHRRIWVSRSIDDGATFSPETAATDQPTGACGCCGMSAFADTHGNLYALYRSAFETVHRDIYLLKSSDRGSTFKAGLVDRWEVGACVMSTAAFAPASGHVIGAWETKGQICFARIDPRSAAALQPAPAPGEANGRKHPALAVNAAGDTLLAWTEGTGWKKGGSLGWQIYDAEGRPKGERGQAPGVRAFSFAAAYSRPDGGFTIVY